MDSMEPLFVANKTQTDAENIGRQKVCISFLFIFVIRCPWVVFFRYKM